MNNEANEAWRANRNIKLYKMLDPDEPAWLVNEQPSIEEDYIIFDVVHRWKPGGWARRRFTYDTVGDVLHFRGTTPVDDSELVKMKPEQRIAHHRLV